MCTVDVEAVVAEHTGLAYIMHASNEGKEPYITLTHLATQTALGGNWTVSLEQEAREWITLLHDVVDWTGPLPYIRKGKIGNVLHLATIGAVLEVEVEDGQP